MDLRDELKMLETQQAQMESARRELVDMCRAKARRIDPNSSLWRQLHGLKYDSLLDRGSHSRDVVIKIHPSGVVERA